MPILSFNINQAGQGGVFPSIIYIQTNDTVAQVTAVGYLDHLVAEGVPLQDGMMAEISTKPSHNSAEVDTYWLQVEFASGHWTLIFPSDGPGSVVLPTIANHIATYTNTLGQLSEDPATAISGGNIQAGLSGTAGHFASFPATATTGQLDFTAVSNSGNFTVTLSNASHGQATTYSIPDVGNAAGRVLAAATATPFTANHILTASGTGGVVAEDANPAINGGSIQAGLSGTAGTLVSFPATAATGSLIVAAASNSGNTNVTISNSSHGQATAYHIADVANASGALLNAAGATPFISGHLLQASGTAGVVSDSGVATSALQLNTSIKAQTTGNIGGAGAGPLTISQAACTSSSVILCSVKSSSNPCYVITIVPGSGSFTVTMSADPGASLIMDYVLFVAAQ
ncbi:hypothetical protein UFOVP270_20 [uncultured Caudovirales phage]|uniref:Uncharacterized protein n=1 Tax=uncultured Caudovirales phage TaxID=2100421 RepID=A0A6J5LMB1_9CAUD|nr:hypothetical protein UFOVP101_36 [uncultured Caudovirales phage]CAB4134130.1 hypothetical protein UFOVP270_20 [uncultured Caudovirales phage]